MPQTFVKISQSRSLMFYKSKYLSLSINLDKPKEKCEIVTCIKTVPKCTYHKNPQLWDSSAFKGRSLVHTFSEPFLHCDVPMRNLVSDMLISLYNDRAARIYEFEFISIVRNSAGMNTGDTKFPSKVIFESNQSDANERVEKDVKSVFLVEFFSFHVWAWSYNLSKCKHACT